MLSIPSAPRVCLVGYSSVNKHFAGKSFPTDHVLQLYVQKGAAFSALEATDITPPQDAWDFTHPKNAEHFTAAHVTKTPLKFIEVTTKVTISSELCKMGVDHVVIGVLVRNPALGEDCILYNNYVVHPIVCSVNPGKATDCVCLRLCTMQYLQHSYSYI